MQYSTLIRKKDKGYQFIITYKVNDKWKTKSKQGFKKKEDAKTSMDKALDELKKEVKIQPVDPTMEGLTFKQFSDIYIEHISLYSEVNTILAYKTVLNNFSSLDNIEICKISNLDIQQSIDKFMKKGLNVNTIKDYLRKLNTIFRAAIDEYNLLYKMPTKGIKIAKEKAEITKKALNKMELDNLFKDFIKSKYYLLLLIAGTCGLRLGEILGLTWKDIDFKNNTIKVNKQWKQIRINNKESEKANIFDFGTLKSKNSNREVPIPPKTLNELKKCSNVVNIDNRIFKFNNTDSISICINRLLKRKGYDITIHELRHTYATMLISSGVDFKTAAKLLGHTVQQTMKIYSHVNDDMMKRATGIIENIF